MAKREKKAYIIKRKINGKQQVFPIEKGTLVSRIIPIIKNSPCPLTAEEITLNLKDEYSDFNGLLKYVKKILLMTPHIFKRVGADTFSYAPVNKNNIERDFSVESEQLSLEIQIFYKTL